MPALRLTAQGLLTDAELARGFGFGHTAHSTSLTWCYIFLLEPTCDRLAERDARVLLEIELDAVADFANTEFDHDALAVASGCLVDREVCVKAQVHSGTSNKAIAKAVANASTLPMYKKTPARRDGRASEECRTGVANGVFFMKPSNGLR